MTLPDGNPMNVTRPRGPEGLAQTEEDYVIAQTSSKRRTPERSEVIHDEIKAIYDRHRAMPDFNAHVMAFEVVEYLKK